MLSTLIDKVVDNSQTNGTILMQILLANAKIMRNEVKLTDDIALTVPAFINEAEKIAAEMAQMDVGELARQLHCSTAIAAENWERFRNFTIATPMPAIMAYNGQAYKHLRATSLSAEALGFASRHLWITCFLYGLLRPTDAVVPYRMENDVKLDLTDDAPLNSYWRAVAVDAFGNTATDVLVDSVRADDGTLVHLSTEEYEHLFHWQRVCRELKVVQPAFYVRRGEKLSVQAVWAKTCRGAMVRFILENKITDVESLRTFSYEGFNFAFADENTNPQRLVFIRET